MWDASELVEELKAARARLLEYGKSFDDFRVFLQAFINHAKCDQTDFDIRAAGWSTLQFWAAMECGCLSLLYMAWHEGTVWGPDAASQVAFDYAAAREQRSLLEFFHQIEEQLLPDAQLGRKVRAGAETAHGTEEEKLCKAEQLYKIKQELSRSDKLSATRVHNLIAEIYKRHHGEISGKTVGRYLKKYSGVFANVEQDNSSNSDK
jgi:hypothetical protein